MKRACGLWLSLFLAGCIEAPLAGPTDGAADLPAAVDSGPADLPGAVDSGPSDLPVLLDGAACTQDWDCAYPNRRCNAGHCVRCLPQKGDCGFGYSCVLQKGSYACVMGCASESDCYALEGGTMACCNGMCTTLARDPANCGKCGVVCANQQQCAGGVCK